MSETTNHELARILGRMEAKLDEQANSTRRLENAFSSLDAKVSQRLDDHDERLRQLEVANPAALAEAVKGHESRLQELEKSAVRTGLIAGLGSGAGMAVLTSLLKSKLGL